MERYLVNTTIDLSKIESQTVDKINETFAYFQKMVNNNDFKKNSLITLKRLFQASIEMLIKFDFDKEVELLKPLSNSITRLSEKKWNNVVSEELKVKFQEFCNLIWVDNSAKNIFITIYEDFNLLIASEDLSISWLKDFQQRLIKYRTTLQQYNNSHLQKQITQIEQKLDYYINNLSILANSFYKDIINSVWQIDREYFEIFLLEYGIKNIEDIYELLDNLLNNSSINKTDFIKFQERFIAFKLFIDEFEDEELSPILSKIEEDIWLLLWNFANNLESFLWWISKIIEENISEKDLKNLKTKGALVETFSS